MGRAAGPARALFGLGLGTVILSRFVRLFLLNLPCADKDDTAESRKYHPFKGGGDMTVTIRAMELKTYLVAVA